MRFQRARVGLISLHCRSVVAVFKKIRAPGPKVRKRQLSECQCDCRLFGKFRTPHEASRASTNHALQQ